MSKKSTHRRSLTPEEIALGKKRIYIILGMIIIGLAVAIYSMSI
jgi:uncharacterized membrane protein YczE